MSKGRECHTLFLGELGHLGRREVQEAGAEIWGFLGMCVCLYLCVFVHFQTHCSGQNTFGGCVLLSLYSTMFSTEFFQGSLILVQCKTSSAINMYPI